jgi:hypothetical protein
LEFLFRGNAVAAGGFLTRLGGKPIAIDPQTPTTHGESSLPWAGGVSRSLVESPSLRFPQFIRYGRCETYAEGIHNGNQTVTTVRASVSDVRVTTSPSPGETDSDIQSISFSAGSFAVELVSTYTQPSSHPTQPNFKINPIQPLGMTLVVTDKLNRDTPVPVTVDFDQHLLAMSTMQELEDAFLGNRQFFDEYIERFPHHHQKLVFGTSRCPRTPQGYVVTSFVRQITVGGKPVAGHVLRRPGFGTVEFGVVAADTYNRRVTMARIRIGSDPGGDANFSGVETNGIWQ